MPKPPSWAIVKGATQHHRSPAGARARLEGRAIEVAVASSEASLKLVFEQLLFEKVVGRIVNSHESQKKSNDFSTSWVASRVGRTSWRAEACGDERSDRE